MTAGDRKKSIQIIKAIDKDWAFTDTDDDTPYFILVNESRTEHKRLRPEKAFVSWMEDEGLIELSDRGQPKGATREVMEFGEERIVVPLVHFFAVTEAGREL